MFAMYKFYLDLGPHKLSFKIIFRFSLNSLFSLLQMLLLHPVTGSSGSSVAMGQQRGLQTPQLLPNL